MLKLLYMRTPKNPNDPRYLKNHRRLYRSLNQTLSEHFSLTLHPVDIYRRANLAHSTFFDHFKNLDQAFASEQKSILLEFKTSFADLDPKTFPVNKTFDKIIVFMLKNRDFFAACSATHNNTTFLKMLRFLRPYLTQNWRHFGSRLDTRIFVLYSAGLEACFQDWAKTGFSPDTVKSVAAHLTRFTRSFEAHLSDFQILAAAQIE